MRRFTIGSLSLHLILFLIMILIAQTQKTLPQIQAPSHEVIYFDIKKNQEPSPNNDQKKVKHKEKTKNQVVDQNEKPLNNETDPDASLLSANNQKVVHQTISKNRGEFKNILKPSLFPKQQASNTSHQKDKWARFQVELPNNGSASAQASLKPSDKKEHSAEDQGTASHSEQSATLDYIDSIDQGLETMLSTKEFQFYTFYRRIRNQLNEHWTPRVKTSVISVIKKGRRIASDQDLTTRAIVILDQKGKLVKVQIIGKSGLSELDHAALDALKAATPFSNPPRGMIDPDGLIRIRWDFVIEG